MRAIAMTPENKNNWYLTVGVTAVFVLIMIVMWAGGMFEPGLTE